MDPATALGVASGILTFLTFSAALLKVGHGVCVTSSGRIEQNMTREIVMDETQAFLDQLLPASDPRLVEDDGLCRLVEESRRIAKDMMVILAKVKPKKSGTVANLRSAIRHALSQPDMDDLEKRLDQCRNQLDLHLNSSYFKNMKSSLDDILDKEDLTMSQLSQLQTNVDHLRKGVVVDSLGDKAQDQFRHLLGFQQDSLDRACQQVILKALRFPDMRGRFYALDPAHKKTFRWILSDNDETGSDYDSASVLSGSGSSTSAVEELDDAEPDSFDSTSDSGLASSIISRTNSDKDTTKAAPASDPLLAKALDNHEGSELSETDESGSSHTVSDVADEDFWENSEYQEMARMRQSAREKFLGWLSSSDGIFHICGKLGSGKSTLMKFLFEHKRTQADLERWAGGNNRLVSASFFFWKPGSKLQKSLQGLCRSLLHDILAARPELIQSALPTVWERAMKHHLHSQPEMDISPQQIQTAFDKLIRNKDLYAHHRFCFFIDGLDEYDQTTQQDYKSMVDMLIRWTTISGGNVKLCVSSREHNVFVNAFDDRHRLRIHDLTLQDIRGYVADRLDRISDDEAKETLIRDIATKSNGIFFWVTLVVKSMREAIEDGVSAAGLAELLDSLPTELEDLFHHILTALDKKKLQKASNTFAMLDKVKNSSREGIDASFHFPPLTLLAYSFLDHYERDKKFAIRDDFLDNILIRETNLEERTQLAAKQLRANCGGLLEASTVITIDEPRPVIDYTHRSVPEYLVAVRNGKIEGLSSSDTDFDAGDAVSSLILAQLRAQGSCLDRPGCYAGLAMLRLTGVSTPNQAPYEFLEYLDSLSIKAKLHDTEYVGRFDIRLGRRSHFEVQHRSFPGDRAAIFASREPWSLVKTHRALSRPIFVAILFGFNEYVVWKLLHDPGTVDTPAKRMVLTFLASCADHPPWDALFESGALSSREKSGFLRPLPSHYTQDRGWDTSQCPWFSAWRQILIKAALSLALGVARLKPPEWRDINSRQFGQAVEQFLRRGVADSYSDLELAVTPVVGTSIEGNTELQIDRLFFRFGDESMISITRSERSSCLFHMVDEEKTKDADANLLQWFSEISGSDIAPGGEMHVTFRQLIQDMRLANQDVLFSLLDSRDALETAATAEEVGGPEAPEEATAVLPLPLLAEQDTPKTTIRTVRERNRSLWDRLDADFALAFGTGVLASLLVASVWMRYSGMKGQV